MEKLFAKLSKDPACKAIIQEDMLDAYIKNELSLAREASGLMQKGLDEAAAISQQAIYKIEKNGARMTILSLQKYLAAMGKIVRIIIE